MNENFLDITDKKDSEEIRKIFYSLLFFLTLSFFSTFLIFLYDKYVVDQAICLIYKEQLTISQTVLTILLFFYGLYYLIIKIAETRYIVRYYFILWLLLLLFFYINERFFNDKYVFTQVFGFGKVTEIKFLDFPFCLLAISIATLIVNRIRNERAGHDHDLVVDLPLKLLEQDKFERRKVYESLVTQISAIDFKEDRSFSVGIVNKWAEGKTSFLNFIIEEVSKDQDTIVVNFNAWFTSQSDSLTNDFFKTLDDELSKYIFTGSLIRRYANNLTQINSVFNLTKYLPKAWVSQDSNMEYFENIERLLKRLNKRIFVVVDDIDRLDNKEVFNVLRMIRNSANFPFLIFLIPFDKEYAINALTENKIYEPIEYLKKIFDVEISLTPINEAYLQPIFKNILKEFIDKKLIDANIDQVGEINLQVDGIFTSIGLANFNKPKYSAIKKVLFKIIGNNRDLIRFTNSVKLSLKHNFGKLYFPDLLILELIKYEELKIYRKLFENKDYLKVITKDNRKVLELYGISEKSENVFSFLESSGNYYNLIEDLNKDHEKNGIVISLIEALFHKPDDKDFNSKLSIYYNVNYLNYIQFNVNGISYEEIENLLDGK